jgi:hypothetical protein
MSVPSDIAVFNDIIEVVNRSIGDMNILFPDTPSIDCVDLAPNIRRHFKLCSHVITGAPAGEHIAVRKPNSKYWHHGVYIGQVADKEGFYVIDFNGETDDDAIIELRDLDCFVKGQNK